MGGGGEPTVAIVILAAGRSSPMGSSGCHRLFTEFGGMPCRSFADLPTLRLHAKAIP